MAPQALEFNAHRKLDLNWKSQRSSCTEPRTSADFYVIGTTPGEGHVSLLCPPTRCRLCCRSVNKITEKHRNGCRPNVVDRARGHPVEVINFWWWSGSVCGFRITFSDLYHTWRNDWRRQDNPEHFGTDSTDIRIPINPDSDPGSLLKLAEVCAFWGLRSLSALVVSAYVRYIVAYDVGIIELVCCGLFDSSRFMIRRKTELKLTELLVKFMWVQSLVGWTSTDRSLAYKH